MAVPGVSVLPALREDLQLLPGPEASDGSPTWAIYDPVRNRHFRIGRAAFEILSRWRLGSADRVIEELTDATPYQITGKDFEDILHFLTANSLVQADGPAAGANFLKQYEAAHERNLAWLGRTLFFFRIPVLRAERLLKGLLPFIAPLFTKAFRNFVLILGVIGLYLVMRQFDSFIKSFDYFFSWQGFAIFALCLISLKVMHEFAHAFTATRFGARVSNMGIAFMVFFPVLYTDVSDAWRIPSRRKRLLIGAAGIIAELYIALICTFLWSFLPDGSYRSAAFFLATTSWVWTLAINVNPFMKFDGYYLLSDYWSIENLQGRAFNMGVWRLREVLFNLGHAPPEALPRNRHHQLIGYAWLTWLYRVMLFLSIGYFIFSFFFKLAGIILLSLSAYRFILKPVFAEFAAWYKLRGEILKTRRTLVSLLVVFLVGLIFIFPWDTRVKAPAIYIAAERTSLFAPIAARIDRVLVAPEDQVYMDQVLFELGAPSLDTEMVLARQRIALVESKLNRRAASAPDRANVMILTQELEEQRAKLLGLAEQKSLLTIRAPFDGKVVAIREDIQPGRWIGVKEELAKLIKPNHCIVEAVLLETDLGRVKPGDGGKFIADEIEVSTIPVTVNSIENANLRSLHIPYLQSVFGGPVAVRVDEHGNQISESSIFRVISTPDRNSVVPARVIRGIVVIDGLPTSIASRVYTRAVAVFVRESGF